MNAIKDRRRRWWAQRVPNSVKAPFRQMMVRRYHKVARNERVRTASTREVAIELFKLLRFLLILAAAIGIVTIGLAIKRGLAVIELTLAAEEYAFTALEGAQQSTPLTVPLTLNGIGEVNMTLAPRRPNESFHVAEAIEAAAGVLKDIGLDPVGVAVTFKIKFSEDSITANLWPAENADWLFQAFKIQNSNLHVWIDPPTEITTQENEREKRVIDRCKDKWLPVTITLDSQNPDIRRKLDLPLNLPVRMGPQRWWQWTGFTRINGNGEDVGIVPPVNVSDLRILASRAPFISMHFVGLPLDCYSEYVRIPAITWSKHANRENSYLFTRSFYLTSVQYAGNLKDNQDLLMTRKQDVIGGLQVSQFYAGMLLPYVALVISLLIATLLRQIYSCGVLAVEQATWAYANKRKTAVTHLDRFGIAIFERLARVIFLVFALISLPLSPVLAMYSAFSPLIANADDFSFMMGIRMLMVAPAGWVFFPLLLLFLHQSAIIFNVNRLLLRKNR